MPHRTNKTHTKEKWLHLPYFYGTCETNLGCGQVVESIRDYNCELSKNFQYYMDKNGIEFYRDKLDELKKYFLEYRIIPNYAIENTK